MTDLFVGELLALVLMIPVLLRPFVRRLQRLSGLALFPLLSLLLCFATISAEGLSLTFVPVLLLSVLVFLAGLGRLFRLFRHLPTDLYTPPMMVFNGFILLVFLGVLALSVYTMPEASFISRQNVRKTVSAQKLTSDTDAKVLTWLPPAGVQTKGVVVYEGDVSSRANARATMASILAENGYKVIAANFHSSTDYGSPFLSYPSFRSWLGVSARVFPGVKFPATADEIFSAQTKDFARLIELARSGADAGVPLYAIAEGSACGPLIALVNGEPGLFVGAVCILGKDEAAGLGSFTGGATSLPDESGMMPADAGKNLFCVISGSSASYVGMGELSCDDILATLFVHETRDLDRKNAEFTARRIASWIVMRGLHEGK